MSSKKRRTFEEIYEDVKNGNSNLDYGVDDDYIDKFLTDANTYLNNAYSDYSTINADNAKTLYDTKSSESAELKSRAFTIRAYLNSNKDNINSEYREKLLNYLDSFTSESDSIFNSYRESSEKYSYKDRELAPGVLSVTDMITKTEEEYFPKINQEITENYKTNSLGYSYLSKYDDSTRYTDIKNDLDDLSAKRNTAADKGEDTTQYDNAIQLLKNYVSQYYNLDSTDLSQTSIQHRQDVYSYNQNEIDSRTGDDNEEKSKYLDSVDLDDEETVSKYLNHDKDAVDFFMGYRTGRIWQDASNQEKYNTLLSAIKTAANNDTVRSLKNKVENIEAENTSYKRTHPEDFLGSYNDLRNESDFSETSYSDIANSDSDDKQKSPELGNVRLLGVE